MHDIEGDDWNLSAAISNNSGPSSEPVAILAKIDGENDEKAWHWLCRLKDGRFAYMCGFCDFTGWELSVYAGYT